MMKTLKLPLRLLRPLLLLFSKLMIDRKIVLSTISAYYSLCQSEKKMDPPSFYILTKIGESNIWNQSRITKSGQRSKKATFYSSLWDSLWIEKNICAVIHSYLLSLLCMHKNYLESPMMPDFLQKHMAYKRLQKIRPYKNSPLLLPHCIIAMSK